MELDGPLAREALLFGLLPGAGTTAGLYLLDTGLLGRNLRGVLLLVGAVGGLVLAAQALKSRLEPELAAAMEQQEHYLDRSTSAAADVREASENTLPGFLPHHDLRRRLVFYAVTVSAASAAGVWAVL